MKMNLKTGIFRLISICLSVILIFSVFLCLVSLNATAASYIVEDFAGGSGTESDPFQIANANQLYKMANSYGTDSSGNSYYYKLIDNIDLNPNWDTSDLSECILWTDKSSFSNPFCGNIDGDGFTIKHLYLIKGNDDAGLIKYLSKKAVIKNLNIDGFYCSGKNVAAVAGSVIPISNGSVETNFINITVKNGTLQNTHTNSNGGTGAILGNAREVSVTIENCVAENVIVTANDYSSAGAIAGRCRNTSNACVVNLIDCGAFSCTGVSALLGNNKGNGTNGQIGIFNTMTAYDSGNGTKISPYVITTPSQLYKMVAVREENAYYELGCDIVINDTSSPDWYLGANVKKWLDAGTANETESGGWKLHLEGNGHSVKGLYCKTSDWRATGLVPILGNGSSISNVHIRDSYYTSPSKKADGNANRSYLGGITGYVVPNSEIIIGGCTVDSSVEFNGGDMTGGILGGVASKCRVVIEYCGFSGNIVSDGSYNGGIYAIALGSTGIKYCYSIGNIVGGKDNKGTFAKASYTYSTEDQSLSPDSTVLEVTQLEESLFLKDKAKDNLEFNWNRWSFIDGYDYPFPHYILNEIDGVIGEAWSGNFANDYQPYTSEYKYPEDLGLEVSADGVVVNPSTGDYYYGEGTDEYPYHIATGEQLAKMVKENCSAELADGLNPTRNSFLIIADIYLNDISDPNWTSADSKKAHNWLTGNYLYGFRGHLDGGGHIVFGLRFVGDNTYIKTGLIPVIGEGALVEKIGVVEAYVSNESMKSTSVGGIAGYVQQYGSYIGIGEKLHRDIMTANGLKEPIISECFVADSYFKSNSAGSIVCDIAAPVTINNCYSVNTSIEGTEVRIGAMVGNCYNGESALQVNTSYCIDNNYIKTIGGGSVALGTNINGSYTYTKENRFNFKSKHPMDMYGESAYKNMPELFAEGNNCWTIVENGTPVLSAFGERAKKYTYNTPIYTTVTFTTSVQDLIIPSVTGVYGEPMELPTPEREGYIFGGWYYYPEYQCEVKLTAIPRNNVNVYAKWIKNCITQDFEQYLDTEYDRDPDGDYQYYRLGVAGYDSKYVHGGAKSIHRKGNTALEEDILLNYEEKLTVGTEYELRFWACTDIDGTNATVSLVRNTWPDINLEYEPANGIEKMVELSNMKSGEWKQYTFKFTANTEWVSIRTSGNASLYFDDFVLLPLGKGVIPDFKIQETNKSDPLVNQTVIPTDTPTQDETKENVNTESEETNKQSDKSNTKTESDYTIWIWISISIGILVLVLAVLGILFYNIKKRKKSLV